MRLLRAEPRVSAVTGFKEDVVSVLFTCLRTSSSQSVSVHGVQVLSSTWVFFLCNSEKRRWSGNWEMGAGIWELGAGTGNWEPGVGSWDLEAGISELGAARGREAASLGSACSSPGPSCRVTANLSVPSFFHVLNYFLYFPEACQTVQYFFLMLCDQQYSMQVNSQHRQL